MKPCAFGDLQPPFSHPIQSAQGGFPFPGIAGGGGAATSVFLRIMFLGGERRQPPRWGAKVYVLVAATMARQR